ncbi:MAG: peptidase M28, partial [Planctomycetes bacterium]|nr:peptidase M28 [Planctomycetota bacterium]
MYEQIRANRFKSSLLISVMAVLIVLLGFVIGEAITRDGGMIGITIALAIWFIMVAFSYFGGSGMMLAMSSAKPIEHKDHPQLVNVVEEMAIASGLPVPKIYLIEDSAPNAF